ncbi:MAG: zeta toxin family protein [Endomicrobia bacterium]|nr:zeta toxin family protein [Endomicrobiia bacterium]
MKKELNFFILAGANGVGKTSLSNEILKAYENSRFLNADEIAKSINPKDLASVRILAGKKLLSNLDLLMSKKETIILESTIAGKSLINLIKKAKTIGYKIYIFYTFADSPEVCIERIKDRVKKGGHFVPDEDVRRRFYRSINNFWNIYRHLADVWVLYYNMENSAVIAKYAGGSMEILLEGKYKDFIGMVSK